MQYSKLFKSFYKVGEISNTKSKSFMHKQQTLEKSINRIAKQEYNIGHLLCFPFPYYVQANRYLKIANL